MAITQAPLPWWWGFPCPTTQPDSSCAFLFLMTVVKCDVLQGRWADLHSSSYLLWKKWRCLRWGRDLGREGRLFHVLPKQSCSAELRGCQATNPDVSVGDVHERSGMGLALGVRNRWNPLQSPGVLRLYLFIMGRERWVLCSLSLALSEASNSEWD